MPAAFTLRKQRVTVCALRAASLLGIGLVGTCLATDQVAGPLVGTWRLVSYTDTIAGEPPIHYFGTDPVGLFIFTADGHASISIMRNPPDAPGPATDPDPGACNPGWFCAYFGTYEVDYQANAWITHVRGGNIPTYLGTDQRRHFAIHGDRLTIYESFDYNGKTVHAERVLVRESRR